MKPKAKKPIAFAPAPGPVKKRVMLVDDHPMLRAGLAALIDKQMDLVVCCEAEDPGKGLQAIDSTKPDLIVTDLTMPGRGGLELIKDLKAMHPGLPVLVLYMHDEMLYAELELRAGARGYLMKEAGGEKFLAAMRHVLGGKVYVSERMSAQLFEAMTSRKLPAVRVPRPSKSSATASSRSFNLSARAGTPAISLRTFTSARKPWTCTGPNIKAKTRHLRRQRPLSADMRSAGWKPRIPPATNRQSSLARKCFLLSGEGSRQAGVGRCNHLAPSVLNI